MSYPSAATVNVEPERRSSNRTARKSYAERRVERVRALCTLQDHLGSILRPGRAPGRRRHMAKRALQAIDAFEREHDVRLGGWPQAIAAALSSIVTTEINRLEREIRADGDIVPAATPSPAVTA